MYEDVHLASASGCPHPACWQDTVLRCPLFLAERVFVVYIFCVFDALATYVAAAGRDQVLRRCRAGSVTIYVFDFSPPDSSFSDVSKRIGGRTAEFKAPLELYYANTRGDPQNRVVLI